MRKARNNFQGIFSERSEKLVKEHNIDKLLEELKMFWEPQQYN